MKTGEKSRKGLTCQELKCFVLKQCDGRKCRLRLTPQSQTVSDLRSRVIVGDKVRDHHYFDEPSGANGHFYEQSVRALADKGLSTFAALARSNAAQVQTILNRNVSKTLQEILLRQRANTALQPPFGQRILDFVRSLPEFSLTFSGQREDVEEDGVEISLDVEIGLANTDPPPITKLKRGETRLNASVLLITSDQTWIDFRRIR